MMPMNVLSGLFLCTMFTRVFSASDPKAQSNGTEESMETIVVQHKLDLGGVDSRLSNLETAMESRMTELKSLILQLVRNGNGVNGSHQVGGQILSEINSTGENIVDSEDEDKNDNNNDDNQKSNVMGKEHCTLEASRNFQVFEVKRKLSFLDAEAWCKRKGGEMAVLRSLTNDCFLDPKYNRYMQGYGDKDKHGWYWISHKSLPLNEPNWKSEGWPKNPHEYFRTQVLLCNNCGPTVPTLQVSDGVFKFDGSYTVGYICEFRSE